MIPKPKYIKHYHSATARFFNASLEKFFEREFSMVFGPHVRKMIVNKITEIMQSIYLPKDHIKPGQILWNAVSIMTRPGHPHCIHVPVILSLITESDIEDLCKGIWMSTIMKKAIARITKEAYTQGAVLSMRDIGLFSWRANAHISKMRIAYEKEFDEVLPHTGNIHDMGTTISHKVMIIRKVVLERKDPSRVSRETNHSQEAVDKYLKDFHRVKTCYLQNKDLNFISQATGMSKKLVREYIRLIEEFSKKDLTYQMR